MQLPTFLTAEWRYLVMLNYPVEPKVLERLLPRGTELDFFEGRTFVSMVGFRFLQTRIFGIRFPFHTDFEEVNLRFYVRRKRGTEWRRGVVFVRELVPRRAIAFIARTVYGEPYTAVPMSHRIDHTASGLSVEYAWQRAGGRESLRASAVGEPREIASGSEEEFITEHYWGYNARRKSPAEYEVEHPRWKTWRAVEAGLDADVSSLYGERFAECLSTPPASAFIADGSPVRVRRKSDLQPSSE